VQVQCVNQARTPYQNHTERQNHAHITPLCTLYQIETNYSRRLRHKSPDGRDTIPSGVYQHRMT